MSRAGIKQLVLCDLGTMASSPANLLAMGLRTKCTMDISPYKSVKDYRNRELPNMDDVKIETETLQPSLGMLKKLINFTNHNCDAQITTAKQNASSEGDIYRFIGENSLGLDFELEYSNDKRSIKVTLERAFPKDVMDTLLAPVEILQGILFMGLTNEEGIDYSKYRSPFTLKVESPAASVICSNRDFESKKITIKTSGKKSIYNSSFVDYLTVTIELETRDASAAKLISQRGKGISPSFLWQESNGGVYYDAFSFAPGVLAQKSEFKNNDDDRIIKISYGADIPIYDFAFEFGADKGGDETDTEGTKGGTLKVN